MGTGKQTTKSQSAQSKYIDPVLQQRGDDMFARALMAAQLGYQPNRGVTIAGFTPMQQAGFQNINNAASAFGMVAPSSPMQGMPAMQTSASGIQGYSTGADFDDMMSKLPPGYRKALESLFINPQTGAMPQNPFNSGQSLQPGQANPGGIDYGNFGIPLTSPWSVK